MGAEVEERFEFEPDRIDYDTFLHLYRYRIVKQHLLRQPAGSSLLDCASGSGYGAKLLSAYTNYTGVDISEDAVHFSRTHFNRYGRFYLYDGSTLPFPNEHFDVVSSIETIEHLPKHDHDRFISELLRVLKPGGLIILTTPNRDYLYKRYLISRGWSNPYHKYEYTMDEFRTCIKTLKNVSLLDAFSIGPPMPLPMRRLGLYKLPFHKAQQIADLWIALGKYFQKCSNVIVVTAKKG